MKSQLFWPETEGQRDAALWARETETEGQAAFFSFCMRDIGTEGQRPKNCVKCHLLWPGTEGRRRAALNLSDIAFLGQGTLGQWDRLPF